MVIEAIRNPGEPDANIPVLLESWGFEPDSFPDILEKLQSPDRPHNIGIDVGTTALDFKQKGDFSGDPYMGSLALIGPDNKVGSTGVIFEEPSLESLRTAHAGGIGNAANAVASVLRATRETPQPTWAVMAWLGGDDVGNIWRDGIEDVDKSLLRVHPTIPYSGLSVVLIQAPGFATETVPAGERAIYFRAGASGATEFSKEHLVEILKREPFNVNISYPGLFPDGADRSKGENLGWFVGQAQKVCPCVSMDTHGFTRLEHIEQALPYIDMFNSNFTDAARVFLGETVNEYLTDDEKMKVYGEISAEIREKYVRSEVASKDRCRMFTITDRKGTFLIFINPKLNIITNEYLPSPCAAIPAKDKTGAGDVRFGLQRLYVAIRVNRKWEMGQFKWDEARIAVNIGQIGTALHLQGKEAHALEGVSIDALEKLARSGNEFGDLEGLKRALAE